MPSLVSPLLCLLCVCVCMYWRFGAALGSLQYIYPGSSSTLHQIVLPYKWYLDLSRSVSPELYSLLFLQCVF